MNHPLVAVRHGARRAPVTQNSKLERVPRDEALRAPTPPTEYTRQTVFGGNPTAAKESRQSRADHSSTCVFSRAEIPNS